MPPPFIRLGVRLLLRVLAVFALFGTLLTALYATVVWREQVAAQEARIAEIQNNLVAPLINSVWHFDQDRIVLQLDVISRMLPGAAIRLDLREGNHFSAGSKTSPSHSVPRPILLQRPGSAQILGTLTIAPDPERTLAQVRRSIEKDLLLQIASIILFASAFTFFMHRLVVRRITALSEFARNLDPGKIETNAAIAAPLTSLGRHDEIDILTLKLDHMRQRILAEILGSRRLQAELSKQALHDPLTGLGNRAHLSNRAKALLNERGEGELAFAFLDIDRLKLINDSLGHAIGDQLLCAMARRMEAALPEAVEVFRPASDEFLILIPEPRSNPPLEQIISEIQAVMGAPFQIENHEIRVTTTIGVTVAPDQGNELSTLLRHADIALQAAKKQGRGHTCYFDPSLLSNLNERVLLESLLRKALENGEFELHYQPQVAIDTGRLIGAEALLRWHNPQLGTVAPDRFIPIAEDSGQIVAIGNWVLETACKEARRWQDAGLANISLSVNLSAVQLRHIGLTNFIRNALEQSGLEGSSLEVEVTESVIMDNVHQASERLQALRQLGIRIAIDDFGTGYSSMAYLKHLPIDRLKIDRAFIADIPQDANDTAIAIAIIRLADALNLTVIAEGVEKAEQAALLLEQGCPSAQGYYFSRPLPAEAFLAFALDAQRGGKLSDQAGSS